MTTKPYQVLTIINEPFVMYNVTTRRYSGMLIDLMNELARALNFTYIIKTESEGNYGMLNDNGTWNGMIGDLVAGKADVALATTSVNAVRSKIVDFTDPVFPPTGISILMQKPVTATDLFSFFALLDIKIWLCIGGLYLLTSFLLCLFDRHSPYSDRNRRRSTDQIINNRLFDLRESLWFCLTSHTPQGGGASPANYSSRLVAVTWWLFGFIIVASYTANLAAYFTLKRREPGIDNVDKLFTSSSLFKYNVTTIKNSEAERIFSSRKHIERKFYEAWRDLSLNNDMAPHERSRYDVWDYPLSNKYTKISKKIDYNNAIGDLNEALERFDVVNSKFALITETTDVKFRVMINCTLQEIGPEFAKRPIAIALRRGSTLTDKFNYAIRDLESKRWMNGLRKKWWDDNPKRKNCRNTDERVVGVIIENIGGLFATTFIVVVVAYVVLMFEYLFRLGIVRRG